MFVYSLGAEDPRAEQTRHQPTFWRGVTWGPIIAPL